MKLFVSGSSPLDTYVEEEIRSYKNKKNFQELIVQKLKSKDILKNPTYIQNDDVVICGATIYEVFKRINVRGHIIPMRVQTNDFLNALHQAAMVGKEINIINYKKLFLKQEPKELEKVFNIKINQYCYKDEESAEELIEELLEKKQNVVVGSGLIVSKAINRGMSGFIWYGKQSVNLAVETAFNVLLARFEEQSTYKRQQFILDNFNEGVISLNATGRIIQINNKAVKLLDLQKYPDVRGLSLGEIDELDGIEEHLNNKNYPKDKLLTLRNRTLYLDSFPITVKGNNDGSVITVSDTVEIQKNEKEIRRKLHQSNKAVYHFDDIIGNSDLIQKVKNKAKKFAKSDANVLILGESGTGKELFAQSIHNASLRSDDPFMAVNCTAIPENLMESEFFGYSEGAFTGAMKGGKPGLFELAHKGTVFLDELGEIPLSMQTKLLRVLQEKVVRRVGSSNSTPIDVRIIAATNANLLESVKQGNFRLDLFYRICVLNLVLPSLNERKEDIKDLVLSYTLRKHPNFISVVKNSISDISILLEAYQWDGNIRELENNLERFFAYLESPEGITKQKVINDLKETLADNNLSLFNHNNEAETYQDKIKEAEVNTIQEVLQKTKGNKKEAANLLGMSRSTLWRKLKEADLV